MSTATLEVKETAVVTTQDWRNDVAMNIADQQDQGAAPSNVKFLADAYTGAMKQVCNSYRPHMNERGNSRIETVCHSGYSGKIWEGAKCLICEAFCQDVNPAVDEKMRKRFTNHVARLVQIEKMSQAEAAVLIDMKAIDPVQFAGRLVRPQEKK